MDRVVQDGLQRVCIESNDRPPADLAKQLEADQMKTIASPEGSLIGDWKRGERIAQGGRGLTWNDKPGAPADGSCYNCHQLSPQEMSHGTLGPSLLRFGATPGNGAEVQRYVYGKIYNAKAYNLCSQIRGWAIRAPSPRADRVARQQAVVPVQRRGFLQRDLERLCAGRPQATRRLMRGRLQTC